MFTALNHATGVIVEAPELKTIYHIITGERRADKHSGERHDFWTIHRGDRDHITESFLQFDGTTPEGNMFPWAF